MPSGWGETWVPIEFQLFKSHSHSPVSTPVGVCVCVCVCVCMRARVPVYKEKAEAPGLEKFRQYLSSTPSLTTPITLESMNSKAINNY